MILSKRFLLAFGHCHLMSYLLLPTNFLKGSREQVITEKSQHLIRANKLTCHVDRGLCPLNVPSLSLSLPFPPTLPVFSAFFLTLPFGHLCFTFSALMCSVLVTLPFFCFYFFFIPVHCTCMCACLVM